MKLISASEYVDGVLANDRRIIAKAMTLIESTRPADQELAVEILDQLMPHTGRAIRLGVTGVPGAGKSTLLDRLGIYLIEQGHRVAVLAIDPSSVVSGGSILADKTRMEALSQREEAFIRPSPTRGHLGGVGSKTRELRNLCDAAGYDVIIIETVGVGQSEVEVATMVDFFLVLMIAGGGDEFQGIKKGIMELADTIVINKADLDNKLRVEQAKQTFRNAISLLYQKTALWSPPVLTCSALRNRGIEEIWQAVLKHQEVMKSSGELRKLRTKQAEAWMWRLLESQIKCHFLSLPVVKKAVRENIEAIEKQNRSPMAAARALVNLMIGEK